MAIVGSVSVLTLLHSEWPKLYGVLAVLSAIGLTYKVFVSHMLAGQLFNLHILTL